jgi:hypothetical protein
MSRTQLNPSVPHVAIISLKFLSPLILNMLVNINLSDSHPNELDYIEQLRTTHGEMRTQVIVRCDPSLSDFRLDKDQMRINFRSIDSNLP